ncbi:MAG: glycine zipper domain-containing protein [Rhizomicrobium sp.]
MKRFAKIAAASLILFGAGTMGAFADECSGHSHYTGTVLGAGGGALLGGLASHSVTGAVVGGVAGAFAGNAIARSNDCHRYSYRDRRGRRHYYYADHDYGRDRGYDRDYNDRDYNR